MAEDCSSTLASFGFLYDSIPSLYSSSSSTASSSSSSSSLPSVVRFLKQCRKLLHKQVNTTSFTSLPKSPSALIDLAVQILSLDDDASSSASATALSDSVSSLPSFIDTKECALDLLVTLAILHTSDGESLRTVITDALANHADTGFEKTFVSLASLDFLTAEPLERNLLILLIRLMGYTVFTAGDLLDMCNGLVTVALDSIIAVFRWYQLTNHSSGSTYSILYQDQYDIFVTTVRLFHELTIPGTYFRAIADTSVSSSKSSSFTNDKHDSTSTVLILDQIVDTNALPIDKLTTIFRTQINALINHLLEHPLFESIILLMKPWITKYTVGKTILRQSINAGISLSTSNASLSNDTTSSNSMDSQSHLFMNYLIRTCQNLLLFSTEYGNKLRQHLAVSSGIMNECILPYTRMCITAIGTVYDALQTKIKESLGKDSDIPFYTTILTQLMSSLRSSLTLLSIACFKIRILRPLLRDGVLLSTALQNKCILNDIYCLTAILQLAVNADILVKVENNSNNGGTGSSNTKVGKSGIKKKMFGPVESPNGTSPGGFASSSSTASAMVQSHVNYALLALITDALQQHDDENRIRIARRIQESEDHAVPMVNNGTSYDLLKEFLLIDASRRDTGTTITTGNVSVETNPGTERLNTPTIGHTDSKENESIITPSSGPLTMVPASTTTSTTTSSLLPSSVSSESTVLPSIQARAPHHLPPLRRPNIPTTASSATIVPPRPEADFFAPRCALTGNLLTDPVIVLVPRDSSSIRTPLWIRKPAPGSYTLPYSTKSSTNRKLSNSDSKQADTGESKEDKGNSTSNNEYTAIYCEREAVEDTEDEDNPENKNGNHKYHPFTGEVYTGYIELSKDDPVLSSVQQWQLRRLMGNK